MNRSQRVAYRNPRSIASICDAQKNRRENRAAAIHTSKILNATEKYISKIRILSPRCKSGKKNLRLIDRAQYIIFLLLLFFTRYEMRHGANFARILNPRSSSFPSQKPRPLPVRKAGFAENGSTKKKEEDIMREGPIQQHNLDIISRDADSAQVRCAGYLSLPHCVRTHCNAILAQNDPIPPSSSPPSS